MSDRKRGRTRNENGNWSLIRIAGDLLGICSDWITLPPATPQCLQGKVARAEQHSVIRRQAVMVFK